MPKTALMGSPLAVIGTVFRHRRTLAKTGAAVGGVLMLPILFLVMLPGLVFGDLSENTGALTSNTVISENIRASNQAIVEVALTQLGNEGGQPYWSWYGFDGRVEWCACFVSWCADQCSYIESGIIPKFAGCVDGSNWFKGNGQWQDRNYEPQAGDIIFFDWEGDGETDHVGIVEKCENGVVYTVEGNSGDACRQKQYTVGSSSIYGYGVPAY